MQIHLGLCLDITASVWRWTVATGVTTQTFGISNNGYAGNDMQLVSQVYPDRPWQIAIPTALPDDMITWYHQVLGHVGIVWLYQTIVTHFVHPHLKQCIEYIIKSCDEYLCSKLPGMGYGGLSPIEAGLLPCNEVTLDLIRPWTLNLQQGTEVKFNALTPSLILLRLLKYKISPLLMWPWYLGTISLPPGIQGHCVVFMTMLASLLALISNVYLRLMESRMYQYW
jgi:hypothetical protein